MERQYDPFEPFAAAPEDAFAALASRPISPPLPADAVCVGVLRGFDLLERPLVAGLPAWPGQLVAARASVALHVAQVGVEVVVASHNGDWSRPIIVGVVQNGAAARPMAPTAEVDGERLVLRAQSEVVLECGDASITLTRAGKVLIKGRYVLSRSSGYNKIKGAAVDIN